MAIKVFITPDYSFVPSHVDNGGIKRVAEAMIRHLPDYGVEIVHRPEDAHVLCNHGAAKTFYGTLPIVNVNHGFMWSRQPWGDGMKDVNHDLVDAMVMAVRHTAPSEWVANAMRRGGYFYPEVVYHGVDAQDFRVGENGGYVLWNKARADYVSDPNDMMRIAHLMPKTQFWSTIGVPFDNIKLIGVINHTLMKDILANAGVYLCTARETFGIGTLEAMASGVPVVGWDWGGQSEIVIQGETGYLAPPGDYEQLREYIHKCFAERDRLSKNCIEDVKKRWKWEPRIEQYANIFKDVFHNYHEIKRPKVSVIVTTYKLDKYLPKCLDSITKQTMKNFECLIIDDASQKSTEKIVDDFSRNDPRIRYIPTPNNFGLPGARNFGADQSKGMYLRFVDADDWLTENALEIEGGALDKNPGIHIAYGHLESVHEDGSPFMEHGEVVRTNWPPTQFNWLQQMAHMNQLPSCAMMRREVIARSGGYRERMKRQEDADFWCRVTSLGFRAQKVTQAVTYVHRQRDDSKGNLEWKEQGGEPDWTAWFPWRLGSSNLREARDLLQKYGGHHPAPYLVPFSAQGKCTTERFWYVHDYAYPVVSVIVTCGPNHKHYLIDALDSVLAQTFTDWECIVVNDTATDWKYIPGAPWARIVNMHGNKGVSAARNEGFDHANGKFIIYLDADDYWVPWLLEIMVAQAERNVGVIFSDFIEDDGTTKKYYHYKEMKCEEIPLHMSYSGSSVLIPHDVMNAVKNTYGGWDAKIPGMEDWDMQIAIHSLGFCAYHIPEALFIYRKYSTTKRESDYARIDEIQAYLDQKWERFRKRGEKMSGCGCGGGGRVKTKPVSTMTASGNFNIAGGNSQNQDMETMVRVEYVGPLTEEFSIRSRVDPSVYYRFGQDEAHKQRTVFAQDAEFLISLIDGNGNPNYRIIGNISSTENRDPAMFLGTMVAP